MSEKAGFLGLGLTGGVAAGAVVVAAVIGVLYATGTLAPDQEAEATPSETVQEAAVTPEATAPEVTPSAAEPEAPVAVSEPEEALEEQVTEDQTTEAEDTAQDPGAQEETATVAEEAAPSELRVPTFDVVRASPDGTTVVAGVAEPGSTVDILVDSGVADTQIADAQGQFVSLLTLPTSIQPRVLTLISRLDTLEMASGEEIILAPTPAAPQVAAAEPEPDPQPAPQQSEVTTEPEAEPAPQQAETPVAPEPEAQADQTQTAAADEPAPLAQQAEVTVTPEPVDTSATQQVESTTEPEPELEQQQAQTTAIPEQVEEPATTAEATSEPQALDPAVETAAAEETPAPAAPAAVAVLRADEEGVELLSPSEPRADLPSDQIALDTIGYSPEGDVLLSGRAAPDALIRVYLNNTARADLTSDAAGRWRGQLADIAPGVYTLRLDALDAAGAVVSRVETPFKRESPEALASTQPEETPAETSAPIRQVTVQTGDTLWAISRERYGDGLLYVRVFEANRDSIRDPDLIYPGQIFTIPE